MQDQSFRIHGCQHSTSEVPGEFKQQCTYPTFNVSTMETAKACKFFCRGRSISPTQDLEIHLRHELPCTCLLSCSWNMPKVPGDCYLSPQMELKLGLSPSNHFGKAKVHEEAEEKTTHNKCGCEAEVHVLQLAFHIMEPHTIKWGFLPNIPGPLPGFDFLGIIIEHHNESPFVLAVNKALTWRRLEGHSGGSHLQNDLVDLTAAAMHAQQLRLFGLARSSISSNTQSSMHEEDRGTSSSIVPEEHSRCLLIQEASPREAGNKSQCLTPLPDKSRLLPQTN